MAVAKSSHRVDEMLAGVQDQQYPPIAQISDQIWCSIVGPHGQSQHRGDDRRHQIGIAHHAEVDEEHGAGKGPHQLMSDSDRKGRLADAPGADDRDKTRRK
jgi:hypothetical protein